MNVDARRSVEARWVQQLNAAFASEGPALHLRRAQSLTIEWSADRYSIRSFLSGSSIRGGAALVETLRTWVDWRSTDDVWFRDERGWVDPERVNRVVRLVELGIVVVQESPFEKLDSAYTREWHWGSASAAFNLAIRDVAWARPDQVVEDLTARRAADPGPPLTRTHDVGTAISLPEPALSCGIYETMAARESARLYSLDPISLGALARIVHSGMGIASWSDEGPFGVLPHAMTPSGGARNPYEAYVAVRAVDGLAPGVYHYSATQHSLQPVANTPAQFGDLLGNLDWVDSAAAVIMLVADFRRTMWKYKHPTAHRVVLIEGGHIAQNMLLAAAHEEVASVPIAAFNDAAVESLLALDALHELAVHAVVVGIQA